MPSQLAAACELPTECRHGDPTEPWAVCRTRLKPKAALKQWQAGETRVLGLRIDNARLTKVTAPGNAKVTHDGQYLRIANEGLHTKPIVEIELSNLSVGTDVLLYRLLDNRPFGVA